MKNKERDITNQDVR